MNPASNHVPLFTVWAELAPAECREMVGQSFLLQARDTFVEGAHVSTTSLRRETSLTRSMLYLVAAHALDALVAAGDEVRMHAEPDANGDPDRPPTWTVRARRDGDEWEATAETLAEAEVAARVATLAE